MGVGSPAPKPRELSGGMFGYLPDAFDSKSLKIGQEDPHRKRKGGEDKSEENEESPENVANGAEETDAPPEVEEEPAKPMAVLEGVSSHLTAA